MIALFKNTRPPLCQPRSRDKVDDRVERVLSPPMCMWCARYLPDRNGSRIIVEVKSTQFSPGTASVGLARQLQAIGLLRKGYKLFYSCSHLSKYFGALEIIFDKQRQETLLATLIQVACPDLMVQFSEAWKLQLFNDLNCFSNENGEGMTRGNFSSYLQCCTGTKFQRNITFISSQQFMNNSCFGSRNTSPHFLLFLLCSLKCSGRFSCTNRPSPSFSYVLYRIF